MPNNFYKSVLSWFQGEDKTNLTSGALDKPLKRSELFLEEYQTWINSTKILEFKNQIKLQFQALKSNQEKPNSILFLLSPQSNGFIFFVDDFNLASDLGFFQEYCKDFLIEQGYILNQADVKIRSRNGEIVETERYYLKPKPNHEEVLSGLVSQGFGNILLELEQVNGRHKQFKLQCNWYSDRNYKAPIPFEEFVELLCN